MKPLRSLPPTTLANIVAYLLELGPDDEIRIPLASLNEIERTVTPEVSWEKLGDREVMLISNTDVDSDTTDVVPSDQHPHPLPPPTP